MDREMDKVAWFELPATDVAKLSGFYNTVFGWKMADMGGGSKWAMTTPSDEQTTNPLEPGAINGDISPRSQGFDKPLIVIDVKDMDAKVKMVEDAGGKVILPPQDMTEMGLRWCIVEDPEENRVGMTQNI